MNEQHSLGWFRSRLGKITGSKVGVLMKNGKKNILTEEAMSYIYQLAAERTMAEQVVNDDFNFESYLESVKVETRAMRFGTEMESVARERYCTLNNVVCLDMPLCAHKTIENFGSSPDGLTDKNVTLEIKCPNQSTYMKYRHRIDDDASLLMVNPEYYYQCMAHMMCTGSDRTDFIVFSPFQKDNIHIVPIYPNELIFRNIESRVKLANELIDDIIDPHKSEVEAAFNYYNEIISAKHQ